MAVLPTHRLSEDEYLALEREAETKSEYYDGQIFAMAGGSAEHSLLTIQIIIMLSNQLERSWRIFNSDMRVHIPSSKTYTYSDCTVLCTEPQFLGNARDTILNPLLLIKVISPSTEAYDCGKNFELYRTIPSFREYLLIHQDRHYLEHFSRTNDGTWILRDFSDDHSVVSIESIDVQFSIAELYSRV